MDNVFVMHNSHLKDYREPFGAVVENIKVNVSLETKISSEVFLEVMFLDGGGITIKMDKRYEELSKTYFFDGVIDTKGKVGIIKYYFSIKVEGKIIYYGNNYDGLGGVGNIYETNPKPYQITVYKDFQVPAWYKEGIIYQIFVDRFYNGNQGVILSPKKNSFIYGTWEDNPIYLKDSDGQIIRWDFYGGNLLGVIKKLPYIKSLGATAIYFNPIFESVSNHKYDTGDYNKIDPMFGDDETFRKLCKEADKLGIRIILDGVFSHTGAESRYFNKSGFYDSLGAYQSKDSPYYQWYRFKNYPDEYESWWGFSNLPNVEEMNPVYRDFIIWKDDSVINKWMSLGAFGWRLDVADELPDEFIKEIKTKMKEINKDSVLIGEVWEDASNKESYGVSRAYLFGEELDSVTNYPFRNAVIGFLLGSLDSHSVERKFMNLYENYPIENFYASMNLLGNHDTERIYTVLRRHFKEDYKVNKLLRLAIFFQMTFVGVPLIYYGDEVGVEGEKDPDNRRPYPWGRENEGILSFYREATKLRNSSDTLKKGDLSFINLHKDIIAFQRSYKNCRIIVLINRNENETIEIYIDNVDGAYINLCNKNEKLVCKGNFKTNVPPLEVKIFKL